MSGAARLARLDLLQSGLLLAWLAIAGIIGGPVAGASHMFAMASLDADLPICHADGAEGATGHPVGDHGAMAECALCLCCAPILAVLVPPPDAPPPSSIRVAEAATWPAARAPPSVPGTDAYPRGPPALT